MKIEFLLIPPPKTPMCYAPVELRINGTVIDNWIEITQKINGREVQEEDFELLDSAIKKYVVGLDGNSFVFDNVPDDFVEIKDGVVTFDWKT